MSKQLLKYVEWQGAGDMWYCNDTSDLTSIRSKWWVPARMLNLSPADFVKMLIEKFKPDNIWYSKEHDVLGYSWENINDMRKYKNWLNAEARKRSFII